MQDALVIGGTRFIGRHLVRELLAHEYSLTLFNRGRHENPFAGNDRVGQFTGDRTSDAALTEAREAVDPDIVIDCVAYHPGEVQMATRVFEDVTAYVFVSSGSAYGAEEIPKREDETPLASCTNEQAIDNGPETYGNRKAESDRAVFEAAAAGGNAMSVRPTIVYGPHDYTGRLRYWVNRIREYDRVLVPGDGTNIHHLVGVESVARAIRTVAEAGTPGEAYNVADRRVLTLQGVLKRIAAAVDRDPQLVYANPRALEQHGVDPTVFPLYNPQPHILTTEKLFELGWEPVAPDAAITEAATAGYEPDRNPGPDRSKTAALIEDRA
ncbi:MAG: nucleoside-diphosphate-sugar epimerase [halophilic archaeon J07HX5]|jgi:Nucleoside-diphosphate-sugar epimerases|nr:MAG: nucleoside-diphosphate-sugar epimerase [halophilic archaeon J07HX5]